MHLLVVDDDFGCRIGMVATLTAFYPDAVLHQAASVKEAVAQLTTQPSMALVLLDLNLGDSRGLDSLRTLRQWCEENDRSPRIVVVSAAADYDDTVISEAIDHCATGFVAKGTSEEVFRSAIELTLAGSLYIPERYLRRRSVRVRDAPFTAREQQVAELLVQGLSYKQIARRLAEPGHSMSDNTVRVHVQRMAWKLRPADDGQANTLTAKATVLTELAGRAVRSG